MYIERLTNNSDWIIYLLLLCIVLIAILRRRYPHRFETFISISFQVAHFRLYNRDLDHKHPFTFISSFLNILSSSLFLYLCMQFYFPKWEVEGLSWYIRIATLYTILLLGKLWIEQILGLIIKRNVAFSSYVFEKLLARNMLSIFILIWNILLLYVFGISAISMLLAGASILLLNALSVVSIYTRNSKLIFSHVFYFIVYLCLLEIGPYLLIMHTMLSD